MGEFVSEPEEGRGEEGHEREAQQLVFSSLLTPFLEKFSNLEDLGRMETINDDEKIPPSFSQDDTLRLGDRIGIGYGTVHQPGTRGTIKTFSRFFSVFQLEFERIAMTLSFSALHCEE